uniref:C-type lectin domain-containing protein n=1 Tax=Seriola lalandi dorsalis TaxID=1841481 RepID=A0A3B4WZZ2_SERLL
MNVLVLKLILSHIFLSQKLCWICFILKTLGLCFILKLSLCLSDVIVDLSYRLSVCLSASVVDGCCPLGWELSGTTCYLFSRTPLAWPDARDWCNGHESHLVILNTEEEWDFVTHHGSGTFYWVGLTDGRTGKWEWVNQTPYVMNRSWTGHGLGQGDEDCAHLHTDGRLNDLHCSTRLRYICQRRSQHT